ncbi:hypothetical protein [Chitinophaga sp.]|uniref:hypothetical protein n=1 Tax=Chitinophaga sp. TaxID=1869181 RepID=UPI002C09F766|nr:hypothetical protein [Chitinophaga sp.]HWV65369.1 hypothetical protein [Chitinophaga sp.]
MKQYISLLLLSGVTVLFSCKKEKSPDPSPVQLDPYMRVDNPSNEADHQIYLLYKETGIPVLYSDTLTRNPVTLLNAAYQITTYDSTLRIKYLTSSGAVLTGLNFVKSQILPALGGALKPFSILLADSATGKVLVNNGGIRSIVTMLYSGYPTVNTLIISRVNAIAGMAPDTLTYFKKDIFKAILQTPLGQRDDLLKNFVAVSADFYNKGAYGDGSISGYLPYAPRETYGLVSLSPLPPSYYSTGTQVDDISGYFDLVLTLTKEQFAAKYGNYPLVMTKYDLFTKALAALGFKMP